MKLFGLARLGRNGEMRRVASGEAVINLALAYNYGKKDDSGNRPTQWVDASFWGARAEALSAYLVKGQQFLVEVREVRVETYAKNDGTQGVKLVGTVDNIEFAGSAPGAQSGGAQPAARQQAPQQQRQAAPQRQAPQAYANAPRPAAPAAAGGSGFEDFGDDIPFIDCSMFYDMTTSKQRKMSRYDY